MGIKTALLPIINILSLISCILAVTVLISASIFYDIVKSEQKDVTKSMEHKAILKHYELDQLLYQGKREQIYNIYGTKPLNEKHRPFDAWILLQQAVCVKYQLAPAYLFFSLASITLALIQIGVALWCAFTTTLKLDAEIIKSIWMSRALLSHLIVYALSFLLFNFMNNYSQYENEWIETMKNEMMDARSDHGQFSCHHTTKEIHIIVQIINLAFLGIDLIIIITFADFFQLDNWKFTGIHNIQNRNNAKYLSNISSLKSIGSGNSKKGFLPPILDENEEDDMDPALRKKSV